jgi:putative tryptophan/tyrosine transport system substrate-binding protein
MKRREFITLIGAGVSWPLAARAEPREPVIGLLLTGYANSPEMLADLDAIRQGLLGLGYSEGRNIVIETRYADGVIDRLPILATELVRSKVDVIVAFATPGGRAAQQATDTIPIVISAMGDPVQDGLVASLARPGKNVTGTTFLGPELVSKRLALLKELIPTISRVAVLWHPGAFSKETTTAMLTEVADAAGGLGVVLQHVEARNAGEFERAFNEMAKGSADAMLEFPSPMFFVERKRMVELATRYRLPAMYNAKEFVQLGGLIAYGASILDLHRRAAVYVDKILRGAKPADLPVEQPTKFELFISAKVAKEWGFTVPPTLLARADEVIE